MQTNRIVTREEWLEARKAHLEHEKAHTRARDRLFEERRTLPWVRLEKDYVFESENGPKRLADLFQGRDQLFVYHFMLTPGSDHLCPGCTFITSHVDAARVHFENAGLSYAAIARAPLSQILPIKKRFGWRFQWVSSNGTDFNYDFGVSFTPEQIASGAIDYNYTLSPYAAEDLHGISVFARGDDGQIYHCYSTYARGAETLDGAFMFLDMVPKGRNEGDGIMNWVRYPDEYGRSAIDPHHNKAEEGCCG